MQFNPFTGKGLVDLTDQQYLTDRFGKKTWATATHLAVNCSAFNFKTKDVLSQNDRRASQLDYTALCRRAGGACRKWNESERFLPWAAPAMPVKQWNKEVYKVNICQNKAKSFLRCCLKTGGRHPFSRRWLKCQWTTIWKSRPDHFPRELLIKTLKIEKDLTKDQLVDSWTSEDNPPFHLGSYFPTWRTQQQQLPFLLLEKKVSLFCVPQLLFFFRNFNKNPKRWRLWNVKSLQHISVLLKIAIAILCFALSSLMTKKLKRQKQNPCVSLVNSI